MNFEQLFKQTSPEEISDNVFTAVGTLTGNEFYTITAGKENHYNSMVGSGGGLGVYMKMPATWCLLRSDRYTLEIMEKIGTYTLSYFPAEHKKQVLFLGSKSGRDSEKMKETQLTSIRTPTGNMSFKEANIIIECKLLVLSTVTLDELCAQEAKDYVSEEYKDENHYRKLAFGEITHVWVKK